MLQLTTLSKTWKSFAVGIVCDDVKSFGDGMHSDLPAVARRTVPGVKPCKCQESSWSSEQVVKGVCAKGTCKFCSLQPYLEKNLLSRLCRTQRGSSTLKVRQEDKALKLERNEFYFLCCHSFPSIVFSHFLQLNVPCSHITRAAQKLHF